MPSCLRVLEGRCPNLVAEAGLYRYGDEAGDRRAEQPVDEHNHALAALRYLVSRPDAHRMARERGAPAEEAPPAAGPLAQWVAVVQRPLVVLLTG